MVDYPIRLSLNYEAINTTLPKGGYTIVGGMKVQRR
jgi:hypothetical protein